MAFDQLTRGCLLWRAMCCLLGGIGVVMMSVALLPMIGSSGFQMFRSEVSTLAVDRLTPRLADTARWIGGYNLAAVAVIALALIAMADELAAALPAGTQADTIEDMFLAYIRIEDRRLAHLRGEES